MRRKPHTARHRVRRFVGATAAAVLLAGGVAACGSDPGDTLSDFINGWRGGDLSHVGFVTAQGAPIPAAKVLDQLQTLSGDLVKLPLVVKAQGAPKEVGDTASSTVKLDWTLPGGAPWSYESTVRLAKSGKDWKVIWEPSILNSELTLGDALRLRRVATDRAGILDGTGKPLVTQRAVVTVGVTPNGIKDLPGLTTALDTAFKKIGITLDLSTLKTRVAGAPADGFVDLVTLRQSDYLKIRPDIQPLDGTVFRDGTRPLAPTRTFARALLGTADAATKDDIDASPDTVAQGDIVGHGGLQKRYDSTLRGTPGLSVVIARTAPDNTVEETQIFSTRAVTGKPIKTTLDPAAQNAADAATATEKQPSSLVAIRISDGSVLAVSNGPDGGTDNTAFVGQVPPGSTFKVVSSVGLLQKKAVTADTVAPCPKTRVVDGRTFKNAADEVLGNVAFHVDFAKSCNTAFIGLAPKLGADGLASASAALGLGAKWDVGIDAFTGKVSAGDSATELAAASFGQGTTIVSPLAMASVAAAVARGKFVQPKVMLDPAPTAPAPDGAPLGDDVVTPLRAMMREVVTNGTGTALRNVPGQPVFGKTGTAEFDSASKDTHAWFIGWQGDVAFAVMVQKGGAGADTAVPIVDKFLRGLGGK
jgi:cell division protein FtsI/penicillin-binding protein 2